MRTRERARLQEVSSESRSTRHMPVLYFIARKTVHVKVIVKVISLRARPSGKRAHPRIPSAHGNPDNEALVAARLFQSGYPEIARRLSRFARAAATSPRARRSSRRRTPQIAFSFSPVRATAGRRAGATGPGQARPATIGTRPALCADRARRHFRRGGVLEFRTRPEAGDKDEYRSRADSGSRDRPSMERPRRSLRYRSGDPHAPSEAGGTPPAGCHRRTAQPGARGSRHRACRLAGRVFRRPRRRRVKPCEFSEKTEPDGNRRRAWRSRRHQPSDEDWERYGLGTSSEAGSS